MNVTLRSEVIGQVAALPRATRIGLGDDFNHAWQRGTLAEAGFFTQVAACLAYAAARPGLRTLDGAEVAEWADLSSVTPAAIVVACRLMDRAR